jgi:hypothetical protein
MIRQRRRDADAAKFLVTTSRFSELLLRFGDTRSFIPQRNHRIDTGSAARRHHRGRQRGDDEERSRGTEHNWVPRLNAKQLILHQSPRQDG